MPNSENASIAEAKPVKPKSGIWRSYDVTDGLPAGARCLYQDAAGYLWIGTNGGGVSVFDGQGFITYTTDDGLVHNNVRAICNDGQQRLWFGTYGGGVSMYDGHQFVTYTTDDGLAGNIVGAICRDGGGRLWFGTGGLLGTGGGVSVFDGQGFDIYTTDDGLAHNSVLAICRDKQQRLWFGTEGGGASVFDGQGFITYTTDDGLAGNIVGAIYRDRGGRLWFGTDGGGVSMYNGHQFVTYTTDDGLLDNRIIDLLEDKEARLWFAQPHSGVSCLDSRTFQLMTQTPVTEVLIQDRTGGFWFGENNLLCYLSDGQQHQKIFNSKIFSLLVDSGGALWVGTQGDGLYRYDSSQAVWDSTPQRFTAEDGLSGNDVWALLAGRDGTIWLGTQNPGGICRFDGREFFAIQTPQPVVFRLYSDSRGRIWFGGFFGGGLSCYDSERIITYTMTDDPADNSVLSIVEDNATNLWIGTWKGLCCFDGEQFITSATGEGLSSLNHQCSAKDINGHLWFGTQGGGLYRYNGKHFQQLTTKDGLLNNGVTGLLPQPDGSMIIGTYGGIVHYRPTATVQPSIEIRSVTADRVYSNPTALQLNTTGADLLTISYHGVSLATQKMRYSYILESGVYPESRRRDDDWHDTWENSVSYEHLPVGQYTFLVIAINRDLVESQAPATLKLTITPDPRDQQIAQLESELESEIQRRNRELEAELRDAHDVQMALMPEAFPSICGIEIAGRCLSATEVSGDFFDYLPGESSDEIAIVVGDVTGHGMKGAMNAVMASGILRTLASELGTRQPKILVAKLNTALVPQMAEQMNVTMVIGLINTETQTLTLANAGHHAHPLVLRNGKVRKLVSKGMPLGMMASISYREVDFQLQSGDVLVFMSDGIIEAENSLGSLYSVSGRLEQTVVEFKPDLPASTMVDSLINDVIVYSEGKASEKDDMTVVVVKVQ